jgi:cell division protein FtsZ
MRSGGPAYTQPILTQNAAPMPRGEVRVEPIVEAPSPAVEAAESAALRGAFIAPKPVDPGTPRQVPLTHPAMQSPAMDPSRQRGRGPSLIERVTGVGRRAPPPPVAAPAQAPVAAPRPAAPAPQPPPRLAQPRLAPLESEERTGNNKEDDLLDIPAFLRRQAN